MQRVVHQLFRLALPLIAACGSSPERAAAPPAVAPPAATRDPVAAEPVQLILPPSAADHSLPALQLARLEYTFQAAELVRRDWPAMEPAQTCVMLVEPTLQWVLNCDVAPAGFAPTAQRFRDHAVYVHEGGSFDAGNRARTTAQLLAETPAAAQVPSRAAGADRIQGLPGAKPWLVVGSLEALSAFHPAFKEATTEAWVSVLVHELVHTHQLRAAGAERFADAIGKLERTPSALTALYVGDHNYQRAVDREYALLTRAARLDPTDTLAARRALARWLVQYDQRIASLPSPAQRAQLVADDALFSYLEGVARFVESQFLEDPSLHPAHALTDDPRFGSYQLFLGRGYLGSPNRQLDKHYFYAIGYHVCVLLDRVDPSWRSRVHSRERFLVDLVRAVAVPSK